MSALDKFEAIRRSVEAAGGSRIDVFHEYARLFRAMGRFYTADFMALHAESIRDSGELFRLGNGRYFDGGPAFNRECEYP